MPSQIELKTTSAVYDVAHDTLKSESGALQGKIDYKYNPSFSLGGRELEFKAQGSEQALLRPRSLAGFNVQIKLQASTKLGLIAKYTPVGQVYGGSAKLKQTLASRPTESELKFTKGKPVAGEFEIGLIPNKNKNKLQLETIGTKVDAVKWTVHKGLQQLKFKMIVPKRQFVLGLDGLVLPKDEISGKSQKWDLMYNCSTGFFNGSVKVWPMKLEAQTTANRQGVKPITWLVTMERKWIV